MTDQANPPLTPAEFEELLRSFNKEKGEGYVSQASGLIARYSLPDKYWNTRFLPGNTMLQAREFHDRMQMADQRVEWGVTPSAEQRLLRAKLLWEELRELFDATGIQIMIDAGQGITQVEVIGDLSLAVDPDAVYDPIEAADGIADCKVILNGTADLFGIPQTEVDNEVWASNMSKLDEDGNPIVNRCNVHGCMSGKDGLCDDSHLIDPAKPRGKILKPEGYVPANIVRLFRSHAHPILKSEI